MTNSNKLILHLQDRLFKTPGHWDGSPCFLKPILVIKGLCQCLHVHLHTCLCIDNLQQSISYIITTECSSYTERERELAVPERIIWTNGTTLDYNCHKWQPQKRTKTWPNFHTHKKYFTVATQNVSRSFSKRYKIKDMNIIMQLYISFNKKKEGMKPYQIQTKINLSIEHIWSQPKIYSLIYFFFLFHKQLANPSTF